MPGFWELAQDEVLDAPGKDGEYRSHCVPATAPTLTLKLLGDGCENEPVTLWPLAEYIPGEGVHTLGLLMGHPIPKATEWDSGGWWQLQR